MGSRQENWFYRTLSESKTRGATWRVVGSQIIISRIFENDAGQLSPDNWNVSVYVYLIRIANASRDISPTVTELLNTFTIME